MGPEPEVVMRIDAVASLRLPGGVRAGSVVRVGDALVLLSGSAGGPAAAAGLRIDAMRQDAARPWQLDLPAPGWDDAVAGDVYAARL